MFAHTQFKYNDISSETMNVTLVKTSDGLFEQSFGYNRDIVEDNIGEKFYFLGFEKQPLEFEIEISKIEQGSWTQEERRKIVQWLFTNSYKPFMSMDYPNIVFYCMPVGECRFTTNGMGDGYATITMRCNSPYAYTPMRNYHFHVEGSKEIEIFNPSNIDINVYPTINVKANTYTTLKIIHKNMGGYEFELKDIYKNQEVKISGQTKQIYSNRPMLKSFNKHFMTLKCGMNRFEIKGNVDIDIEVDYPISV